MVQQTKPATQNKSSPQINSNNKQTTMSYQKKDAAGGMAKKETRGQNGNSSGFRTDTAISGNRAAGQRELQRWQPDEEESKTFGSALESTTNGAGWDQFAVNEKLFGVKSNYNDNFYTTEINKNAPDYASKLAAADKVARAIEKSASTNAHIREERTMDHTGPEISGQNEEDKFSGVLAKDFPALGSTKNANAWVAPHRRAPTAQPTVKGAPVDPAIITTARPKPVAEDTKPVQATSASVTPALKAQLSTPPPAPEAKASALNAKPAGPNASASVSRTVSPNARVGGTPNATATVERDLASAFKTFASQQRVTVEKMRSTKARADKESKLSDLKKFSETFKLNSPVPSDLVSIIAKDPAKQREIQEKSRQNAEQQEREKQAKLKANEAAVTASTTTDAKTAQRNVPLHASTSTSSVQGRQNMNRGVAGPPQAQFSNQSLRGNASPQGQQPQYQARIIPGGLGQRLKAADQNQRQPPTGPANGADTNFSRHSSSAASFAKLNPSTQEFRPNAFAQTFVPPGNLSSSSSPRTGSTSGPVATQSTSPSGGLMRKKLSAVAKSFVKADFDIIGKIAKEKCPSGKEKAWATNGNFQPAYDNPPTWRAPKDDEPEDSTMNLTYEQMLSQTSIIGVSPSQAHTMPPVAHQHQLPFHLQQGAHNSGPRNSPRQPSSHQNHMQGPNGHYNNSNNNSNNNNGDDHRMMPSHSAQSFVNSPRMQSVNIAYASPMGQPQMLYNQGMQYPMGGPQTPQIGFRSYSSGGPQYMPQQPTQMGAPVMIQGPGAGGFMGPGMSPGPQMMYPAGGQFMQGPPPMMPGANGYPSPGRGGAMMMQQNSQQGHQPVYGMSPAMQYGQPIFAQAPQGQMANMRGGYPQGQQFSTSPQMNHQFNQHRGPSNNFKNYQGQQSQHGSHPPQQNQIPAGSQARPDMGEDTK